MLEVNQGFAAVRIAVPRISPAMAAAFVALASCSTPDAPTLAVLPALALTLSTLFRPSPMARMRERERNSVTVPSAAVDVVTASWSTTMQLVATNARTI